VKKGKVSESLERAPKLSFDWLSHDRLCTRCTGATTIRLKRENETLGCALEASGPPEKLSSGIVVGSWHPMTVKNLLDRSAAQ